MKHSTDTEVQMLAALRLRHEEVNSFGLPRWVYAEHVRSLSQIREADAIALDGHAPTERLISYDARDVHGFEVKVSRSDWLRERRTHAPDVPAGWKSWTWGRYCTHWWLVVPDRAIVRPDELPDGWGLLVGRGRLRASRRASRRPADPLPDDVRNIIARTAIKTDRRYRPAPETTHVPMPDHVRSTR